MPRSITPRTPARQLERDAKAKARVGSACDDEFEVHSETPCDECPLRRRRECFQPIRPEELELIADMKQSERCFEAGDVLIAENSDDAPLYTLLEGWAFRSKQLPDGRRQILDVLMPGAFIGLQQRITVRGGHAVQALTDVRVCEFKRGTLLRLHEQLPSLGMDLTWLAANGEGVVDAHLLSVGRRSAFERLAALLLMLWERAGHFWPPRDDGSLPLPLTQSHLADALGLSLVHVNRQFRRLVREGLLHMPAEGWLRVDDEAGLAKAAQMPWPRNLPPRPLI